MIQAPDRMLFQAPPLETWEKPRYAPMLSALMLRGIEVDPAVHKRWKALAGQPAIVVANHVSLWDGPLLAAVAPTRIVGVIDREWNDKPLVRAFLQSVAPALGEVVPVQAGRLSGIRTILANLWSGAHVVIFPEGGIARRERMPGFKWLVEQAPGVGVLELELSGAKTRYRRPARISVRGHIDCAKLKCK